MFSFDNFFFSVKSRSLNFIELIIVALEMKDVNRRTDTFEFASVKESS